MPPISLFGRHWRIASDDFVYSSVAELLLRLVWIVIEVIIFILHIKEVQNLSCLYKDYQKTTIYLLTSLSLSLLTCVSLLVLASQSARGSIFDATNPKKRHWVAPLLYVNIFLTVGEFMLTITGTYFIIEEFRAVENCRAITGVLVVIGCSYVLVFKKTVSSLMVFKPFGEHVQASSLRPEERQKIFHQQSIEKKKLQVKQLKCLLPCHRDKHSIEAFKDIAHILSSVFYDQQMVISDVLAALVLINHKQRIEDAKHTINASQPTRNSTISSISSNSSSSSNSSISSNPLRDGLMPSVCLESGGEDNDPVDWSSVVHYYKFANAAYGFSLWYVIEKPCALFSILPYLNCMSCRQGIPGVEGEGVCCFNLATFRALTQVELKHILYLSNKNSLQEVPFFMVADEKTKSIIISLRGTLSLHDVLTDLRAVPREMADESMTGLDCRWKGHGGMVEAARKVYKILHGPDEGNDWLKVGPVGSTTSRLCLMGKVLEKYPGYTITVTGHSLGAGTAAILAFMLRAKYHPGIKVMCYAYSPPGGLLNQLAAKESEKFIVSVVVGQDLVPRLSIPNIYTLSERIRKACEECRAPKYKILGDGILGLWCTKGQSGLLDQEVARLTKHASSSNRSMSTSSQKTLQNATEPSVQRILTKMVLPGRIFHITPSLERTNEKSSEDFLEILVSPSMLTDHMPNYVADVLIKATPPQRKSN